MSRLVSTKYLFSVTKKVLSKGGSNELRLPVAYRCRR